MRAARRPATPFCTHLVNVEAREGGGLRTLASPLLLHRCRRGCWRGRRRRRRSWGCRRFRRSRACGSGGRVWAGAAAVGVDTLRLLQHPHSDLIQQAAQDLDGADRQLCTRLHALQAPRQPAAQLLVELVLPLAAALAAVLVGLAVGRRWRRRSPAVPSCRRLLDDGGGGGRLWRLLLALRLLSIAALLLLLCGLLSEAGDGGCRRDLHRALLQRLCGLGSIHGVSRADEE